MLFIAVTWPALDTGDDRTHRQGKLIEKNWGKPKWYSKPQSVLWAANKKLIFENAGVVKRTVPGGAALESSKFIAWVRRKDEKLDGKSALPPVTWSFY